jgi:CRISPR-associated protein (TIGR02710 family)
MQTELPPEDIRLVIASLGGSPQPALLTISKYRPERVIFFSSHNTVRLSAEVIHSLDYEPKVEYEITENPNLLSECYKKCRLCIDRAEMGGYKPEHILIDYTGGTKVMTAALLLSGVGKKYRFNYVGGDQRNKSGVGIVLDGQEKLFAEMSPWVIFAEEERRQVVTLFNRHRFAAVVELIDTILQKQLPFETERYFTIVQQIARSLLKWDQFEIKMAYDLLSQGITLLQEHIQHYPKSGLNDFSSHLSKLHIRLKKILSETKGLNQPHDILVIELLNNARRKMADKRNDDAAARIYRALELFGQICFLQETGCTNDSVKPEMVPKKIRENFIRHYQDRKTGLLKLPQQATFHFLKHKNNDAGIRFFERLKEIKNIQSTRNKSILAHGLNPVGDSAVQSIFNTISEFVGFSDEYDFPRLR